MVTALPITLDGVGGGRADYFVGAPVLSQQFLLYTHSVLFLASDKSVLAALAITHFHLRLLMNNLVNIIGSAVETPQQIQLLAMGFRIMDLSL